jgi:hypothetical protein
MEHKSCSKECHFARFFCLMDDFSFDDRQDGRRFFFLSFFRSLTSRLPPSLPVQTRRDDQPNPKGKKVPETKVGGEGSSKRNIQRKHDHDPNRRSKPQHGGGGGKGKWNDIDDGSIP